ncbi:PRC-barrel domain-containing protein [Sphingopyxis sp.]|uniref:PRC-barrel domain-containing protein n=1 Tax=Sphingopyxis sp. TaxID=1908224 RepID=UPI001D67AF17|nr:PRC-barrel domain-containing protein [Sphingopyxis sp.]MBW8295470.1 PRC-barrel domain-containing protein [Sphingopyxis sp.]
MIAAMMTAANLGARVTGWGFVVFTLGSICWSLVGLQSGQTNLVATNIFLTCVNLVGIWRWLGRQRGYEDGAKAAAQSSRHPGTPTLFSATGLAGMAVSDISGESLGRSVEAMIECRSGRLSYIVVATGGIAGVDEELRSVPIADIECHADGLMIFETKAAYECRPTLARGEWPARVEAASSAKRYKSLNGPEGGKDRAHASAEG